MKKFIKSANESKSPISYDVPIWKRLIAYMLDWYLGSLFTSLPMIMIYMKVTDTQELNVNLFQYPEQYWLLAGGLGLLFAFFLLRLCTINHLEWTNSRQTLVPF